MTPGRLPIVVSDRADGLGERLRGLTSAMVFARLLGVDFRFTWRSHLSEAAHHAITPPEDVFSAEFLAAHWVETLDRSRFLNVDRRYDRLAELAEAGRGAAGWLVHQGLYQFLPPDAALSSEDICSLFLGVGWSAPVRAAVDGALAVDLSPDAIGVHLRAGDIIYGRYRFSDAYARKVIPLPIARRLIADQAGMGRQVVVFNQDRRVDALLSAEAAGVVMASTLSDPYATSVERAMFEIVLMSRCRSIHAGESGFAQIAAEIADTSISNPQRLYDRAQRIEILSRAVLRRSAQKMPRLQRAFCAYALFKVAARDQSDVPVKALRRAMKDDPENVFYPLRLATYLIERGDVLAAEAALRHLVEAFDLAAPSRGSGWTPMRALLARSPRGDYRLRRDHAVLRQAALSGDSPLAAQVWSLIEAAMTHE